MGWGNRYIVNGQRVSPEKHARAVELRDSMTPAEAALWNCLRANQLGGLHFRRQQNIDGFIVDFFCAQAGVVIEVDGPVHDHQLEADRARSECFKWRGLRVARFKNEEVLDDLEATLRRIADFCSVDRGTIHSPPRRRRR